MECIPIDEVTQVAEARRRAAGMATRLGFDEGDAGSVALAATELATNLLKHGGGGVLLLERREIGGVAEVELIAIDRGPGMADVAACLRDGYSTAGSAGTGLGAVRRLARSFGIHAQVGTGTVVLARVAPRAMQAVPPPPGLRVGSITLPKAGEDVCGDSWCMEQDGRGIVLMVADGLGHGPAAAEASRAAVTAFQRGTPRDPQRTMEAIHLALRPTRGAAVAIATIDTVAGTLDFCGVGNIAGTITPVDAGPDDDAREGTMSETGSNGGSAHGVRRLISHNGTAGASARRIQPFHYSWPARGVLVLASDGLATNWSFDSYPGLLAADPAIIAAVLYRDADRGRDDVTVVVVGPGAVAGEAA